MQRDSTFDGCVITFGIGIVLCALFMRTFVGCDVTYSEGFRDGHVQKFSHKGLIVKSWEGEMALAGFKFKNDEGNVWPFSVDDQMLINKIQELQPDTMVRIYYRQVWINAWMWHSSDYRVQRIELIKEKRENHDRN